MLQAPPPHPGPINSSRAGAGAGASGWSSKGVQNKRWRGAPHEKPGEHSLHPSLHGIFLTLSRPHFSLFPYPIQRELIDWKLEGSPPKNNPHQSSSNKAQAMGWGGGLSLAPVPISEEAADCIPTERQILPGWGQADTPHAPWTSDRDRHREQQSNRTWPGAACLKPHPQTGSHSWGWGEGWPACIPRAAWRGLQLPQNPVAKRQFWCCQEV